ncbi:MAG TPA: hypothetical protein VFA44_05640 [Gaiellaceae bacterium]|nr:hypothetical protein [Gaiellaceae bacterium]
MARHVPTLTRWGRALRRGDLVEVRSAEEILATLDPSGCLDGVPFMPEMLSHLGGRFTVEARVERACDTIGKSGSRRMPNTVMLDDLRCDGAAHGGCQAGCRLYWKEAWLRRVEPGTVPSSAAGAAGALERLARLAQEAARVAGGDREVYRCQATEFVRATVPLGWWDLRSFCREVACGNVGALRLVRVVARALYEEAQRRLRLWRDPSLPRTPAPHPGTPVGLEPGDVVRVRSRGEILGTLDLRGKNRGLRFDREMLPYCGQTRRVARRVERFIDEASGELVELKSDCVVLDGVVCRGFLSYGRWFCPRAISPWWREAWLEPVARGELQADDVGERQHAGERGG